jgi:hypothetical protein
MNIAKNTRQTGETILINLTQYGGAIIKPKHI